ncbi:Stp1/IreP family PP2C-type Ser/Thr phosphatase [Fimbriimonas ginsengisoli]|uniref:Protein serine/threonine phosphatase n=1 Tax=Fimbriimonas ginsengisoli Gsoil 348 TaxID=661478 RepID=A0A068NKB8_FIMGI|nr:Stp1/IreP family PP2C-type Ser/Thr phosphatase [Fimbriimonas ginsengisoli]AIE84013.1 protein serine/threonine phosphatase [Fimbriimonas ginsengisoli Gsoil 348]
MDEITAEYAQDQLGTAIELRVRPRTTIAAKTDLGRVRQNNEDKFEYFVSEDPRVLASRGHVYVLCDGMGGHEAGEIASDLTVKTFIDVYLSHPASEATTAMAAAVTAANRFVLDNARTFPKRRGMGTTLTALILLQDQAYTVNVGDSRSYRLRNGELLRLTMDHTVIEEYVRSGLLTPEQAETHPHKHVLTRAIGGDADVRPDIEAYDLKVGDTFLLCSDGVMNHVSDDHIGEILRTKSPAEAAWNIVGQALLGGGTDNTTVIVVRVDDLEDVGSTNAEAE